MLGGGQGESTCQAGDTGLIPGEGNDNPFQYSSHEQRSLAGYSLWSLFWNSRLHRILGKSEGQLLTAPERREWLGQSRTSSVVDVPCGESEA